MKRPIWTRPAQLAAGLLSLICFATNAPSQVLTLDRAPTGTVHEAGCNCGGCASLGSGFAAGDYGSTYSDSGCASGGCASGGCGTVWGTQCYSECGSSVGLFPPCPNPCHGLYLGHKLLEAKRGIDCGIKGLFNHLLSPKGCQACGVRGCDGMCTPLMGNTMSNCGCSDCMMGGTVHAVPNQPTLADDAPVDSAQPTPPVAPTKADDPFTDDSASIGTGAWSPQTPRQAPRSAVRRTSHAQPVATASEVKPRSNVLRRASAKDVKNLRPAGRTTQSRATQKIGHAGSQQDASYRGAARHFQRRGAVQMRKVRNSPVPPRPLAPESPQNTDDNALLRFID